MEIVRGVERVCSNKKCQVLLRTKHSQESYLLKTSSGCAKTFTRMALGTHIQQNYTKVFREAVRGWINFYVKCSVGNSFRNQLGIHLEVGISVQLFHAIDFVCDFL